MASNKTTLKTSTLWTLAALSAIGVGVSLLLTHHYYDLRSGVAGFKSFCNYGASFDCDAIAASSWAELVSGLPLSGFAAGWYLSILAFALLGLQAPYRREVERAILTLSGIGTVISFFYAAVMASVLKTACVFCLVLDAVGLASFVLVLRAPKPWKGPYDVKALKTLVIAFFGCMAVAGVGSKMMDGVGLKSSDIQDVVETVLTRPELAMPALSDKDPSWGPVGAPITLLEFSDFQCPYCRIGAFTIHALMNRFPGKIRVVFKNFPLDSACNRSMQGTMHPVACEAARAALCAHDQGAFGPVFEAIFNQQATIAPGKPLEWALEAQPKLDAGKMKGCMAAPETNSALGRDIEQGLQLGVKTTPTFFLNGRRIEGAYPLPIWIKIVESLLKTRAADR